MIAPGQFIHTFPGGCGVPEWTHLWFPPSLIPPLHFKAADVSVKKRPNSNFHKTTFHLDSLYLPTGEFNSGFCCDVSSLSQQNTWKIQITSLKEKQCCGFTFFVCLLVSYVWESFKEYKTVLRQQSLMRCKNRALKYCKTKPNGGNHLNSWEACARWNSQWFSLQIQ